MFRFYAWIGILVLAVCIGGCGGDPKTPSPDGKWSFSIDTLESRTTPPLVRIYDYIGRLYAVVRTIGLQKSGQWLNNECLVLENDNVYGVAMRLFHYEWVSGIWKSENISDNLKVYVIGSYQQGFMSEYYSVITLITEKDNISRDMLTLSARHFNFYTCFKRRNDGTYSVKNINNQGITFTVDAATGKIIVQKNDWAFMERDKKNIFIGEQPY